MNQDTTIDLLSMCANGSLTTRELIVNSGYSPNTVIRYLVELQIRGLIERQVAQRLGPGRPPIINLITPSGFELLRTGETSLFRKLRSETGALWGPRQTFSHLNVPFFGGADIFVKAAVQAKPFEVVIEPGSWLYEDAVEEAEGAYPSLEALLAWAAKSGNPRYLGAAAVLLRDHEVDVAALVEVAGRAGATNRIGYLSTLAGVQSVIRALPRHEIAEIMLDEPFPVTKATERIARQWRVLNPVSSTIVAEMMQLYGSAS